MSDDAARLAGYIDLWTRACADLVALARALPDELAGRPTDLAGWSVADNVAHTAHLEAVLAGAPEETVDVAPADHVRGPMSVYTEQGVLARRGRTLAELADEIEHSVAIRAAELAADPPTDAAAAPPRTPGGVPWSTGTLLGNRPLDIWMHEQDIRRAVDRPGGYDSPAAPHTIGIFGRGLPMVLGKRVAPPIGTTVRVDVPEAERSWTVAVGGDGRAGPVDDGTDPTVRITLTAQDFVVLAGGRRQVDRTRPRYAGDAVLGRRFLDAMALTP